MSHGQGGEKVGVGRLVQVVFFRHQAFEAWMQTMNTWWKAACTPFRISAAWQSAWGGGEGEAHALGEHPELGPQLVRVADGLELVRGAVALFLSAWSGYEGLCHEAVDGSRRHEDDGARWNPQAWHIQESVEWDGK